VNNRQQDIHNAKHDVNLLGGSILIRAALFLIQNMPLIPERVTPILGI